MMHITLTIQSLLPKLFLILMVAPLPILIFSSPLSYLKERLEYRSYCNKLRKHNFQPNMVTQDQLSSIYPTKSKEELNDIMWYMKENY